MSVLFPRQAVVQRYLHTGARRSRGKIVAGLVLGTLAGVIGIAAFPAGSLTSGAGKLVPVEQAKPVSDTRPVAANPATPRVTESQIEQLPTAPETFDSAGTTGTAVNQPDKKPPAPQTAAAASASPPVTPSPAPTVHAEASVPTSTPVAPAPAPTAPAPVKVATAPVEQAVSDQATDRAPDAAVSKPASAKAARKAASHRRTVAAERRSRTAHHGQPTLVRVYDLPDGRRIYQRVTGGDAAFDYPGGQVRRVYLAPDNQGFD